MKFKKLEPPKDPMPNMTAMVDLVMCILIFFMLGSKFAQSETFLPSAMPLNVGFSGAASNSPDVEVNLTLELKRGGGLGVVVELPGGNGVTQIPAPSSKPSDEQYLSVFADYMKKVTGVLKARRSELSGKIRVVIKPEAALEYRHIVGVFGACLEAGFDNIVFALSLGGGGGGLGG
jgi:biopolymer transport protein ExbD